MTINMEPTFEILNSSKDFVGQITPDGKVKYVNPALLSFSGLASAENASVDIWHSPEQMEKFKSEILPFLKTRESYSCEFGLYSKKSGTLPCMFTGITHRDENGDISAFTGMFRDNSEQKLREEQLRLALQEKNDANVFLESIRTNVAHALITTTIEGTITSFNAVAERMLGYAEEELVGKESPAIIHDLEEVIRRTEEFGKELNIKFEPGFKTFTCHTDLGLENEFEWNYVHKNGTKFPVLLTVTALFDGSGSAVGYVGVAKDLSELRATEKQLRRSNDELAQFAYRTSHDLKAPLATIKGLTAFMAEDLETGDLEEVKINIEKVHSKAKKLESLVVDILDLAKSDLQNESYHNVDLAALLLSVFEDHAELLDETGVVFEAEASNDIFFMTQPVRLHQVLANLVVNSIKYRDPTKLKPFVKVTCKMDDGLKISVRDNGIGIPVDCQHRLFDMFARFHPDLEQGSGLGMSIVKKNVEALMGKISFESSPAGTTVVLNLPSIKETQ